VMSAVICALFLHIPNVTAVPPRGVGGEAELRGL